MKREEKEKRKALLDIDSEQFRTAGHNLVDQIAEFLKTIRELPVNRDDTPETIRRLIGEGALPEESEELRELLSGTAKLLFEHSLFNGHPRFWGFITSSAAPGGALAEMLAASVNPNVGGWALSPVATEIEAQTIRWIAEMMGYPADCGGLLVSGGNMANFVCFLAARKAKAQWDIRTKGFHAEGAERLRVYVSEETHTWIQKAADLFGLGTDSIRWIAVDKEQRIRLDVLSKRIEEDRANGDSPFLVVGSAGTVSTGAVDPLREMAALCKKEALWFHVDGAYGGFAAVLPDADPDFQGIAEADSVAVDPHKWLYAPIEAGCALVRSRHDLRAAFSYHPPYYHFDPNVLNYFDYGPQNSRGFRALKIWIGLRQAGRKGYQQMIGDDIALSRELFQAVAENPELEPFTQSLSIVTFRYVPRDLTLEEGGAGEYLDRLNRALLERIDRSGEAFLSNAIVNGKFVLRACIVNFRTNLEDVRALPEIVVRIGAALNKELKG